jgi:hypothetical protein
VTRSNAFQPSEEQELLLVIEAQTITNLLRDGVDAIRSLRYPARDADAIYTLLSLGVEKLLTLTLGLAKANETGEWPSRYIRSLHRQIESLDDQVATLMRAAVIGHGRRDEIEDVELALRASNASAVWPLLRTGLARYGSAGGHHALDWLIETPQYGGPVRYWDVVESGAFEERPNLSAKFESELTADFDAARIHTNHLIVNSVTTWWHAIHVSWAFGLFGARASLLSQHISPDGVLSGKPPIELVN